MRESISICESISEVRAPRSWMTRSAASFSSRLRPGISAYSLCAQMTLSGVRSSWLASEMKRFSFSSERSRRSNMPSKVEASPADLVRLAVQSDALLQIAAVGDARRRAGDLVDGLKGEARHAIAAEDDDHEQ